MKNSRNDSELDSFLREMSDVTPIKQDAIQETKRPTPSLAQQLKRQSITRSEQQDKIPLSTTIRHYISPYDEICYKKEGVQDKVFKNLRLGKYPVDTAINLNSLNLEHVRIEVFEAIQEAHEKGVRNILIRHGLGLNNKPHPAILKSALNQWLPELAPVIACHTSLKGHGGLASTYVLLKKNELNKSENRELHRKK